MKPLLMYLKHSICRVTCTLSCDETRAFQANTAVPGLLR